MLYVVSQNGADELQIVRIMAAQIISFTFVIAIYYLLKRNAKLPLRDKGGEHPVIIVVTLAAMVVGAIFGAVAFYQGWLG